jgi:HK97 family phage portal protein
VAFWDTWFGRKPAEETKAINTSLELFREIYGPLANDSGIPVNHATALTASVSLACARVISEGLSQVPFRLMRSRGANRLPAVDHPLYALLNEAPNDWQTCTELMDMLGMHLVFCGNAYLWLNRGRNGDILEMLPFEPSMVSVDNDARPRSWDITYTINPLEGTSFRVPKSDMWHIRGPSWNGWMGLDGVALAREAIGLSLVTEKFGNKTFSQGARLSGILTTDVQLNKEQREQLREAWQQTYTGPNNVGKVAVMSSGMKFIPTSAPNDSQQYLDLRRFQVEEVCRAFRVQPIMVGYSDKATTYASAEQMFLSHVVNTLGPWYKRLESSANVALLTQRERREGYYTKFFTQALLRGAAKDRAEFFTKLYQIGAINPNEIRELEDMNPYEGGDRYAVPLNMARPELIDELQEAQIDVAEASATAAGYVESSDEADTDEGDS